MTIKLGLVGTGTVGGGCLDILRNHREDFKRHLGVDMEVVRVCSRNPEQAEARGVLHLFTEDFNDIINDPEIDRHRADRRHHRRTRCGARRPARG